MAQPPPDDLTAAAYRFVAITRVIDSCTSLLEPRRDHSSSGDIEAGVIIPGDAAAASWSVLHKVPGVGGFVQSLGPRDSLPSYVQAVAMGVMDRLQFKPRQRVDDQRRDALITREMDLIIGSSVNRRTRDIPQLDANQLSKLRLDTSSLFGYARSQFTRRANDAVKSGDFGYEPWAQHLAAATHNSNVEAAAEHFVQTAPVPPLSKELKNRSRRPGEDLGRHSSTRDPGTEGPSSISLH